MKMLTNQQLRGSSNKKGAVFNKSNTSPTGFCFDCQLFMWNVGRVGRKTRKFKI